MFNTKTKINFNGIKREIGIGCPVFIVSEIGINHNGNLSLAKECISASVSSGADAVKFQNYDVNDFIIDDKEKFSYQYRGVKKTESQRKMFQRCQFTYAQYEELKEFAIKKNTILFTTPSGLNGIKEIKKLKLPIIKNASDSLINLKLIEAMGKTGKLTVLSTGMSLQSEIDDAVKQYKKTGNKNLILLVCTSNYPTNPENINLSRLATFSKYYKVPVGFSDHTEGSYAAIGAVAMGAVYIEKHFTLNKKLKGPDHWFSADAKEFEVYVESIRNIEKAIGNGVIKLVDSEISERKNFLLSITFKQNLKKGKIITGSDLIFARPATGLPPKYIDYFIGKKLNQNVSKGDKISFDMITK